MAYKLDCTLDDVAAALSFLDCSDTDIWLRAGMAIKREYGEVGFPIWDNFSQGDDRYSSKECRNRWKGWKGSNARGSVTLGTIFTLAFERGFKFDRPELTPEQKIEFAKAQEIRRTELAIQHAKEEADVQRWYDVVADACTRLMPTLKKVGYSPYLGKKKIHSAGALFLPCSVVLEFKPDFTIDIFIGDATYEFFDRRKSAIANGEDIVFLFFKRGSILIPLNDCTGAIRNFQVIYNVGVKKRFLTNGQKSGLFRVIGSIENNPELPVLFCEGFATGVSLFMATKFPVVVCFDAGNLAPVCEYEYFRALQNKKIIAGDNDWETALKPKRINTGLVKAKKAAGVVGGTWCVPEFSGAAEGLSDFNDLQIAEGSQIVAAQINNAVRMHSMHISPSVPPAYGEPPEYDEVPPEYNDNFISVDELFIPEEIDPLYLEACTFVINSQKASIAAIQRNLRIGYNRAARLIDLMHNADIISACAENGARTVLIADVSNIPMPKEIGATAPVLPPAPSEEEERHTIENLLKRYALTEPDAKIWDSKRKRLLKTHAFKVIVKSRLYDEWLEHDDRLTVNLEEVEILAAAEQKRGRGGLGDALRRFVYLNPSDTVWDRKTRKVIAISHLKIAIADWYGIWVTHPERDEVPLENFVFDPTQKVNPKTHINQFRGLALKPVRNPARCERIVRMMFALCNNDKTVLRWLRRWLAYPLINVGAKMETAVLCHSDVHGSGKSYFFDVVMRAIYGEYSRTVGQAQLEGQYNDWMSKVLYCVYEEVLSRSQRYSHTGTIKQTITGKTIQIEKKFMSGWEEANHMNSVFLSNEVLPLPVEPSDRRFLVIWPETKLYEELQRGVDEDLKNGGAAAFMQFLLDTKMQIPGEPFPFDEHTKPPMTDAKERLIEHGRSIWEVFYIEWQNGSLEHGGKYVPYGTVRVNDLFKYFRAWCTSHQEHGMGSHKFASFIGSKVRKRRDLHFNYKNYVGKATFFVIGECPKDKTQEEWLGACVEGAEEILNRIEYADIPKAA